MDFTEIQLHIFLLEFDLYLNDIQAEWFTYLLEEVGDFKLAVRFCDFSLYFCISIVDDCKEHVLGKKKKKKMFKK